MDEDEARQAELAVGTELFAAEVANVRHGRDESDGRTLPEALMAKTLTLLMVPFEEQVKIAGHSIDFVIWPDDDRKALVETNGDNWHHWAKIVNCDRKKLDRIAEEGWTSYAVWASRLQGPDAHVHLEKFGRWLLQRKDRGTGRFPFWDWAVHPASLSERAWDLAARQVEPGAFEAKSHKKVWGTA